MDVGSKINVFTSADFVDASTIETFLFFPVGDPDGVAHVAVALEPRLAGAEESAGVVLDAFGVLRAVVGGLARLCKRLVLSRWKRKEEERVFPDTSLDSTVESVSLEPPVALAQEHLIGPAEVAPGVGVALAGVLPTIARSCKGGGGD